MTDSSSTEKAQAAASTAADEGKHVAGVAQDEAGKVATEAKEQAKSLAGEARDHLTTQTGDQTRQQRDKLVGTLGTLSDDLDQMAERSEGGIAADVAREAAGHARSLTSYLDGREPGELLDDVRDFARRRPGLFLLGALAAGVVVGRVARGVKDAGSEPDTGTVPAPAGPAPLHPPVAEPAPYAPAATDPAKPVDPLAPPPAYPPTTFPPTPVGPEEPTLPSSPQTYGDEPQPGAPW